jgi:hypothetical protein
MQYRERGSMTCQDFQRVLPELEGGRSFEADEHLRMCSRCWDLVSDLDTISQQARLLQGSDEPSPRVWNAIEVALRQEGLIHEAPIDRPTRPWTRWQLRWLVPVAAALLLVSGFILRQHQGGTPQLATRTLPLMASSPADQTGRDEDQLLSMVATRSPDLRAGYASNLQAVDAYIRDAESSARDNPNDQIAQQYLSSAYEQRAMVYEIGMARSLP